MSVSGVVTTEEAASSSRSVVLPDLPARWLDRLLVAHCELPLALGEAAVTRAILDGVRACVPSIALGAVILSTSGREVVVLGEAAETASDARLFPNHAREIVVRVPDASVTSIHAATDDDALDDEAGPVGQLLQRAAFALRGGLELARAHARMEKQRREALAREQLLIQAEKLATLGRLAAGMVHELNNPLTSIIAYTDFLAKRAVDEQEQEKLRRIAESAHRMLRYTRDIVQYARPTAARGPVVVSSVIETALQFCEHLIEEADATVERRFGEGVLPVRGAPEQLAQVFVNLITNAVHAMSSGGALVLTTEADGDDYVRVIVEDNGHGMDAATQRQIFEPFFTTKDDGRGTGLGLSIVKSIVDQHEGTIDVESSPGRGARFVITLPAAGDRPSRA